MEDIGAVLSFAENEVRHSADPKDAEAVSTSAKDVRIHYIPPADHSIQEGDRVVDSHYPVYYSRVQNFQALCYRMLPRYFLLPLEIREWEEIDYSIGHQGANGAVVAFLSHEVERRRSLLQGDYRKEDNNHHSQLAARVLFWMMVRRMFCLHVSEFLRY